MTAKKETKVPGENPPGAELLEIIELIFFAYRDFVAEADSLLASVDCGRAHHRVLHFVNRHPGITVAELLDVLDITKQSLARVLRKLIDSDYIHQQPGEDDKRKRLLFPTKQGIALYAELVHLQAKQISAAIGQAAPQGQDEIRRFLSLMIAQPRRESALGLIASGLKTPLQS